MAIEVFPQLSPRLVLSDAENISMQELVDQINEWEQMPHAGAYPFLAKSDGKVDLGGGVLTGINVVLQNAVLGFDQITSVISTGAATSVIAGFDDRKLKDTGATFISDGVATGMIIYNEVDKCLATVIAVISETELLHLRLGGGSLNIWTVSDTYRIWDVQQRVAGGGNLAAIDADGISINPLHPTMGTFGTRTTSVSATLTEQSAIQYSSFDGAVHVDVSSSNVGTDYPVGTPEFPVNNIADAHLIADSRGFIEIHIRGNLTLSSEDLSDGHVFVGQSPTLTTITILAGANVLNCEFQDCTLTGELDGGSTVRRCVVGTLNYVNGFIYDSALSGTMTLAGGAQATLINCYSGVAGGLPTQTAKIDFGGSGQSLVMRDYSGGIVFLNKAGADAASVDMDSGQIVVEATVTPLAGGEIYLRGNAKVTNLAADSVINIDSLVFADHLQLAAFGGRVHIDVAAGTTGVGFPKGTHQHPVNNLADAKSIATTRGITKLSLAGTLVVLSGDVLDGLTIVGESPQNAVVFMAPGSTCVGATFRDMVLTGAADGYFLAERCWITDLSNVGSDTQGTVFNTCQFLALTSPCIAFKSGLTAPEPILIFESYSGALDHTALVFDMNATEADIQFLGWKGSIVFDNWTGAGDGSIESYSGYYTFNASCTTGLCHLHGSGDWVDNSTGTFTLVTASMTSPASIADAVWDEAFVDHAVSGSFGELVSSIYSVVQAVLGLS